MSNSDAPLLLADNVYDTFNGGNYMISVFLGLYKAFYTVNYLLLGRKLEKIGVRGVCMGSFRFYLTDCKQYVYSSSFVSTSIKTGVLQGAILGPLCF